MFEFLFDIRNRFEIDSMRVKHILKQNLIGLCTV